MYSEFFLGTPRAAGYWTLYGIKQPLNQPADLMVWFVIYFNNEWQSKFTVPTNAYNDQGQLVPVPLDARTPSPPFRGCISVAINAGSGESGSGERVGKIRG